MRGEAFDQQYIAGMVQGHCLALRQTRQEASSGQDPTIKDAAEKAESIIAQHLQLAEKLAQGHNVKVPAP